MAKFNIELEIDWIDEESNLDETVKLEIMSSIERKVTSKIYEKILKKSSEVIEAKVIELATSAVNEKIDDFISKPRNITDKYGEVERENVTIESLFIESMESAFDKKTLSKDGRNHTGYGSGSHSILSYLIEQKMNAFNADVESLIDKEVKHHAEITKENIEQMVTEKIKTQVADKLTNLIMDNSTSLQLKE